MLSVFGNELTGRIIDLAYFVRCSVLTFILPDFQLALNKIRQLLVSFKHYRRLLITLICTWWKWYSFDNDISKMAPAKINLNVNVCVNIKCNKGDRCGRTLTVQSVFIYFFHPPTNVKSVSSVYRLFFSGFFSGVFPGSAFFPVCRHPFGHPSTVEFIGRERAREREGERERDKINIDW